MEYCIAGDLSKYIKHRKESSASIEYIPPDERILIEWAFMLCSVRNLSSSSQGLTFCLGNEIYSRTKYIT
jgi:hypothetical protein